MYVIKFRWVIGALFIIYNFIILWKKSCAIKWECYMNDYAVYKMNLLCGEWKICSQG